MTAGLLTRTLLVVFHYLSFDPTAVIALHGSGGRSIPPHTSAAAALSKDAAETKSEGGQRHQPANLNTTLVHKHKWYERLRAFECTPTTFQDNPSRA